MKIFIKNMVCNRCITAVEKVFNNLKIEIITIDLGEVQTKTKFEEKTLKLLEIELNDIGFQILEDASKQFIENIKKHIILKINELDVSENFILSEYLSEKLNKEYSTISKSFSQNEHITLEQYFILQKIEKVKELLLYKEFTLTEISGKLGYKSVQHLSSQFKKNTGFTPSSFKKLEENTRIPIDSI